MAFQGLNEGDANLQKQTFRSKVAMAVMMATLPILSPIYFFGLLFYQFCLVERLTLQQKFVTIISLVFFSVAWIPYFNLVVYITKLTPDQKDPHQGEGTQNLINGYTPLALFYIFCCWGLWVAFKHFSIPDSYESARDRRVVNRLKEIELEPSHPDEPRIQGVNTAYDLYFLLKGNDNPYSIPAFVMTGIFTGALVAASRATDDSWKPLQAEHHGEDIRWPTVLYVFATLDYIGIFFVFYSVLFAVLVQFFLEVRLLSRLETCLPTLTQWKAEQRKGSSRGSTTSPDRSRNTTQNILHGGVPPPGSIVTTTTTAGGGGNPPSKFGVKSAKDTAAAGTSSRSNNTERSQLTSAKKRNVAGGSGSGSKREVVSSIDYGTGGYGSVTVAGAAGNSTTFNLRDDDYEDSLLDSSGMGYQEKSYHEAYKSTSSADSKYGPTGGSSSRSNSPTKNQTAIQSDDRGVVVSHTTTTITLPPQTSETLVDIGSGVLAEHPDRLKLCPTNVTHLRAWDEVRRTCVEELTSSYSVFNSFFTPTVAINLAGFLGCYCYIVFRIVLQHGQFGSFTTSFTLFAFTMLMYLFTILMVGHVAMTKLDRGTVAIARLGFDISNHLDAKLNRELSIGHTSPSLPNANSLLNAVASMRTYYVNNQKSMKILGFGFGYMKYAAVFFLLVNGNVLFFALMIAVRGGHCHSHEAAPKDCFQILGNGTVVSAPCPTNGTTH